MTIEFDATGLRGQRSAAAMDGHHEEMIQFVFRAPSASGLLQDARALLGAAPRELADSFEQAVRSSGLATGLAS